MPFSFFVLLLLLSRCNVSGFVTLKQPCRRTFARSRLCQSQSRAVESSGFIVNSTTTRAASDDTRKQLEQQNAETYAINLQIAELADQCARRRNITAAIQALDLLRSMKHPDTIAYNSAMKALAKVSPAKLDSKSSTALAEGLLQEMKEVHKQQAHDNEEWYERLSEGKLTDDEMTQGPPRVRIKPNVRSYSTVMDALGRCQDLEAAQKAEQLLKELEDHYKETSDLALRPNLITYNTLLSAYGKCGGVQDKCLEILQTMPVDPDVISYNIVLHAIARSRNPQAGEQAESLLRNMGVQPNARSFTTCMDAWSQLGQPEKAHALLNEMLQLYHETQNAQLRPNAISFSTAIHAYAVSKAPDKAAKAYNIFQDMVQMGIAPNGVTFNNLLNACATSKTQPEIIGMVQKLYQTVLREQEPDHYTFGTVLKACSNLFVKDPDFAPAVFREACRRGQVSNGVLWQLRQAVPVDAYRELVGSDHVTWNELPETWRRNVRDERQRRKRR